ncbi:MAG: hypothetical protein NC314_06390 [Roseburia sp.]|nr:hypothetical protein [Roseburia sp.]MCM1242453.1 hypothetical protein [Roseburia sp.]
MKKRVIICLCILFAVILLFPIPLRLKDGGTVEYKAILYSVKKVHQLNPDMETNQNFHEGTVVELLGIEVFDNVK